MSQNLNIVINCAATVDLQEQLDTAIRVNVTGPLSLLRLAKESPRIEAFCQVSTCYANSDRTGYVEEAMYPSQGANWEQDYEKIL